ncbi:MAG: Putative transmembrane protein [uncultured Paraburkholderia sp.]|nr:MAG: Putative transmembrane protein [uncultured Paraburkholderia sp.]CAH2931356.1 MAG: Putative transmembrane protein [uncultured Paraburkholderia sp.]
MSYKRGLAVVFGCTIAALVSFAATYPRFYPGPSPVSAPIAGGTATTKAPAPSPSLDLPSLPGSNSPIAWSRLGAAERVALAPFEAQWDSFSDERKRKWIKIASRYPKMSVEAQKRLHEHMAEWVRMTPDQWRVARENYQVSKELPREARQNAWKAYQQLPEEQKQRLAASEHKRRPSVVSAPPSGRNEIKGLDRLVNARDHGAAASAAIGASLPVSPAEVPSIFNGS